MATKDDSTADEQVHAPANLETATAISDSLAATPSSTPEMTRGHLPPGELLAGRFRVVRWIASGGMGEVYEVQDCELEKRIAVKVLREEIAADGKAMERFRREISLAQRVTHPSVCRIFDFLYHSPTSRDSPSELGSFSDMGSPWKAAEGAIAFLTMELLVGQTLDARIRQSTPIPTDEALPIVRQITGALAAAHEAGVIHRDLKCSNVILVDRPGRARAVITDFGLARFVVGSESASDVTGAGEVVGSPAYMAPEQATGDELTPATDIYSLGIVLFRMVTGRLPFEAPSLFVALSRRLHEAPPSPKEYNEELDPQWESAILKCLEREPTERFSSALEVASALEAPQPEPIHSAPRSKINLGTASFLVLMLCVFGIIYFSRDRVEDHLTEDDTKAAHRHSVAVLGFKNLSGKATADRLSPALSVLLTTELATSSQLRMVSGEHVARMRRDLDLPQTESLAPDTLSSIGRHLNCEYVVLGSYFAAGETDGSRLRLDLRIQNTSTGETVKTLSETATENELLDLVTRLGKGVRDGLRIDPADLTKADARASIPSNAEAARLYAGGIAELRGSNFQQARELLQQAVAADPNYPLTHSALATVYSFLGHDTKALESIRLAVELSDDLPRQERSLIEAKLNELNKNWDQAIKSYRTLFELFPDNLEYGLELIRVQTDAGKSSDAEITLKSLRDLPPEAAGDPRIDLREVDLAFASGQYERALEVAIRLREKSLKVRARQLAAQSLYEQGGALWRLGRLDEAEIAAHAAQQALLDVGDRGGAALALNLIGVVLRQRGESKQALGAFDEALGISREVGNREGVQTALNNQASVLHSQGDLVAASRLFRESLDLTKKSGNKEQIAIRSLNLAIVLEGLGQVEAALKLYEEGLVIAHQNGNKDVAGYLLRGIGSLAARQGDLAKSRRLFQEALALHREIKNPIPISNTLILIAGLDLAQGRLRSAGNLYHEALALSTETRAKDSELDCRLGLARWAFEENRLEEAEAFAQQAANGFRLQKRSLDEAIALSTLARSRLARGQTEPAREAIDRAKATIKSLSDKSVEIHIAISDARILAAEGKFSEAKALLENARSQAQQPTQAGLHFSIRLAADTLELQNALSKGGDTEDARRRLAELELQAKARDFHLIARKARRALKL